MEKMNFKFDLQRFAETTVPESLVQMAWAKDTWTTGVQESYFNKFMGHDAKSIIQIKEELSKGDGTSIRIPLLMPLSGAGITGDDMLEGNEEAMSYKDFNVYLQRVRNAVKLAGKFEEHKTQINMRKDAKTSLADWLSTYIDCSIFSVLTGVLSSELNWTESTFPFPLEAPSADRLLIANGRASEAAITASDTFNTDIIGMAKRKAMESSSKKIRPINVDGKATYVMVIDQWQARDLKNDPKWIESQQQGNVRGEKNPIFSGALGMWDGVVIHENNRIPRTETGATSGDSHVKVSHGLFLGAQACVFAEGEPAEWNEKTFDYGNQYGVSFGRMFGLQKSKFMFDGANYTDFGCINVLTSSVDD